MIRHILKMVWHRKRSNGLLLLEISLSMLVLFAAVAITVKTVASYRTPLGFDYHDLYDLSIDIKRTATDDWMPAQSAKVGLLIQELKRLPEIEAVGGNYPAVFSQGGMTSAVKVNGRWVPFRMAQTTDNTVEALRLKIVRGRSFSSADDASDRTPVMISQRMSDLVFDNVDPIGQSTSHDRNDVVVGIFEEFRMRGELVGLGEPVLLQRTKLATSGSMQMPSATTAEDSHRVKSMYEPPENLILRVRPGTTAAIEAKVIQTAQAVAPEWSFRIKSAEEERQTQLLRNSAPLLIAGVIACFLLFMVILGLTGVLWQNVTRRREELGLRRAVGSTRQNIYAQIMGEVLVLTTVGIILGSLLLVQIPLLNLLASLPWKVFIISWAISLVLMLLLAAASGLYPAWLAARVQPADALRDE